MFSNLTEMSKATATATARATATETGGRNGKFFRYVCPPVRLGSCPPVAARRPPLEALSGERRRQTNLQRKARKQLAVAGGAAGGTRNIWSTGGAGGAAALLQAARRRGGGGGVGGGGTVPFRRPSPIPSPASAPAPSVRRRKLQHLTPRLPRLADTSVVEWIMSPCQNFEQDSDSNSEEGDLQQTSSRALSAVGSRRRLESRTYIVPSQRIMKVAELKKAQVWPLLAKRERRQQQTIAKQAVKSVLDLESIVKASTEPESDAETQPEPEPEPDAVQADTAAASTSGHNCGSGQSQRCSSSSCSRSNRSSVSGVSQPKKSSAEASTWSKTGHVAGNSKAIKLTSTVIKIIPNAAQPDAKVAPATIRTSDERRARTSKQTTARADPDPIEEPTNVLLMVSAAPKPPPVVRQTRTCAPKTPQPMPRPRPPVRRTGTQNQKQNQPSTGTGTTARAQSQSQPQPQAQAQAQCQRSAASAAVPPPITSKIVCKAQHKVPRTAEDGIDMSYQYFVSIPLKRGHKAQSVRYLYRPMVKSLNPTVRRTSVKRNKKRKGQLAADKSEAEEEPQVNPMEAKAEAETAAETATAAETETAAAAAAEIETEEEPKEKPFKVPALKLNRKYMPLLQMLSQVPYPPETEPKPKSKDLKYHESNEDPQEAEKEKPQEPHGDHPVACSDHQVASTDRQVARNEAAPSLEAVGDAKPKRRRTSIGHFRPIRSVLVDYKPEATRLDSIAGAQISYHAPLRFMRRMEGGEAPKRSTSPDDCQQQQQQQQQKEKATDMAQRVEKSVSFQLSKATSSSSRSSSRSSSSSSSSSSLTDSSELINSFKIDRPQPAPVPVAVRDQRKGKKKVARKNKPKSPNK